MARPLFSLPSQATKACEPQPHLKVGACRAISGCSISDRLVNLDIATAITSTDTVTLSYGGSGYASDALENMLAAVPETEVHNFSTGYDVPDAVLFPSTIRSTSSAVTFTVTQADMSEGYGELWTTTSTVTVDQSTIDKALVEGSGVNQVVVKITGTAQEQATSMSARSFTTMTEKQADLVVQTEKANLSIPPNAVNVAALSEAALNVTADQNRGDCRGQERQDRLFRRQRSDR